MRGILEIFVVQTLIVGSVKVVVILLTQAKTDERTNKIGKGHVLCVDGMACWAFWKRVRYLFIHGG